MLNRRLDMILEAERPTVTVASNRNQEPWQIAGLKASTEEYPQRRVARKNVWD